MEGSLLLAAVAGGLCCAGLLLLLLLLEEEEEEEGEEEGWLTLDAARVTFSYCWCLLQCREDRANYCNYARICCWTDILRTYICQFKTLNSTLLGRTQYKSDQAPANLT